MYRLFTLNENLSVSEVFKSLKYIHISELLPTKIIPSSSVVDEISASNEGGSEQDTSTSEQIPLVGGLGGCGGGLAHSQRTDLKSA